ncbi:MAG TPA: hypothetical protein DET40_10045 [Lentisphaeria bacterium]|nr:MAG: hypothetical protein A2X45_08830 [Lentisphaerae bacterium GWF2_50_93]HCE43877.1 hypothetical protein [Lentisphaeria bacterium]
MDQDSDSDKSVICQNCSTKNSFGSYECINCREVLEYGDTDEPYIDVDKVPEKKEPYRTNWFRRSLFYIPPFIILLFMLTYYLYCQEPYLLLLIIIIFMPWASFCTIDIYNESKRREETRKLDVPKQE